MTIDEFNGLELIYRAALLHEKGEEIDICKTSDNVYCLYLLENFYVEVVFDGGANNYIEVVAFRNGERYDKYLDLKS